MPIYRHYETMSLSSDGRRPIVSSPQLTPWGAAASLRLPIPRGTLRGIGSLKEAAAPQGVNCGLETIGRRPSDGRRWLGVQNGLHAGARLRRRTRERANLW